MIKSVFYALIVLVFMLDSAKLEAHLPEPVIALVEIQKVTFERMLSELDDAQRMLLIARFADLLSVSPLMLAFDKSELIAYLTKTFIPQLPAVVSPQKLTKFGRKSIKILEEKAHGKMVANHINIPMTCEGAEYVLPIEFFDNRHFISLILFGIVIPQGDESGGENKCFELIMSKDDTAATLRNLRTQTAACALPPQKAGECLLNFAEHLTKALGLRKLRVSDSATVRCSLDHSFVNMRRLKTFQKGQSWYESHGFVIEGDPKREEKLKQLETYEIDAMLKEVESKSKSETVNLLKEEIEEFRREHANGKTVSEFMSWLWGHDCRIYRKIDEFLFPKSSPLEIAKLISSKAALVKDLK